MELVYFPKSCARMPLRENVNKFYLQKDLVARMEHQHVFTLRQGSIDNSSHKICFSINAKCFCYYNCYQRYYRIDHPTISPHWTTESSYLPLVDHFNRSLSTKRLRFGSDLTSVASNILSGTKPSSLNPTTFTTICRRRERSASYVLPNERPDIASKYLFNIRI